jgi:hypothetical protein
MERGAEEVRRGMRTGREIMFGNRKRFLRIEKTIINLDQVCMLEYIKTGKLLRVHFTGDRTITIGMMDPDGFERIASALKHGRVKA